MFDDALLEDTLQADPAADARRQVLRQHVSDVMGTPAGRALVWEVLETCGLTRISFTGDALSTAFNEGARNVGLKLLGMVQECAPVGTRAMLNEGKFL